MEIEEFLKLVDETGSFLEADRIMRHQNKKPKLKKLKDGLETKVLKFRPLKDREGRYVPYCDFGYHMGYCKTPEICESRGCLHYYKLYIKR